MLTLVQLDQSAIDRIIANVPGGAANVQDVTRWRPCRKASCTTSISAEQGDPYLLQSRMAFDSLERLHGFMGALQQVAARPRHPAYRRGLGRPGQPGAGGLARGAAGACGGEPVIPPRRRPANSCTPVSMRGITAWISPRRRCCAWFTPRIQ